MSGANDQEVIRVRQARQVRPVEIEMEDGTIKKALMKEMTGVQRDSWMNKIAKKVGAGKDKDKGVTDFTGAMSSLLAFCLYWAEGDLPIAEDQIQALPASAQETLFKACQRMNGLQTDAVEDEKKA